MTESNTTHSNPAHDPRVALFGNTDRWSVASVNAVESFTEAEALARAARSEDTKSKKYGTQATVAAALATNAGIRVGWIADGREGSGTVSKGQYAASFGYKGGSIVSKWITVGNLLVNCGIDPFTEYVTPEGHAFPLWNVLVNKGGTSKVTDLAEKGATPDEVIVELLRFFEPDGKRKVETQARKGKTPEAPEAEGTEEEGKAPSSGSVVLTLMAVRDTVKAGGPDFLTAGDAGLVRDLLAEITGLVGEDKAPARKRAKKAPVAKKAAVKKAAAEVAEVAETA